MTSSAPAGVLLVDKPAGISSFGTIARLRPTYGKKMGHAGTLDPFATGLLVVLTGQATRLASYLVGLDKCYEATVQFGGRSTTEDPEGEITHSGVTTTAAAIAAALPALTGAIEQIPPAASAIHIDGERAYRRFRRGETVTVPARQIIVHAFSLMHFDLHHQQATITVECGSGTYVRSLARDLGEIVGTGAYLTQLRRIRVGSFDVAQAALPDVINAGPPATVSWLPATAAVPQLPRVVLDDVASRAIYHGERIAADPAIVGPTALLRSDGTLIAIGDALDGRIAPSLVLVPG